ncbi:MAG: glycosyltransferase family 2 protein [Acidobacteria bacterium]|nr:glycosyltransferase family 2 protein [Acidobacteriota bacterium]MCW5948820.1 glycosyltransferase family 2 protein [Pyrinomonadaceae bacterium]
MSSLIKSIEIGSNVTDRSPAVSIIIPCYRSSGLVAETLGSVFSQDFEDVEVIVLNDDPDDSDALRIAIEPWKNDIIFIDKVSNDGVCPTRNLGAEHARADNLAFLDADDVWHPRFLTELLEFKNSGGYDLAYTDAEAFGLPVVDHPNFLSANPAGPDVSRDQLIRGECHILPSGTIVSAEIFRRSGGFDKAVHRSEDFDLYMRLMFAGAKFGYLRKLLFKFRLRPGSGTGDTLQRIARCRDVWVHLRERLPFNADELATVARNIAMEEAALARAEGRVAIYRNEWKIARERFQTALAAAFQLGLPFIHKAKIAAILAGLALAPSAVRSMMVRSRPNEVAHMPSSTR